MENAPSTHAMKKAHGIELGETVHVDLDDQEYSVVSIIRLYEENPADGTTYFLLREHGLPSPCVSCVHEKDVMHVPSGE
jgi:hypothetical protein